MLALPSCKVVCQAEHGQKMRESINVAEAGPEQGLTTLDNSALCQPAYGFRLQVDITTNYLMWPDNFLMLLR